MAVTPEHMESVLSDEEDSTVGAQDAPFEEEEEDEFDDEYDEPVDDYEEQPSGADTSVTSVTYTPPHQISGQQVNAAEAAALAERRGQREREMNQLISQGLRNIHEMQHTQPHETSPQKTTVAPQQPVAQPQHRLPAFVDDLPPFAGPPDVPRVLAEAPRRPEPLVYPAAQIPLNAGQGQNRTVAAEAQAPAPRRASEPPTAKIGSPPQPPPQPPVYPADLPLPEALPPVPPPPVLPTLGAPEAPVAIKPVSHPRSGNMQVPQHAEEFEYQQPVEEFGFQLPTHFDATSTDPVHPHMRHRPGEPAWAGAVLVSPHSRDSESLSLSPVSSENSEDASSTRHDQTPPFARGRRGSFPKTTLPGDRNDRLLVNTATSPLQPSGQTRLSRAESRSPPKRRTQSRDTAQRVEDSSSRYRSASVGAQPRDAPSPHTTNRSATPPSRNGVAGGQHTFRPTINKSSGAERSEKSAWWERLYPKEQLEVHIPRGAVAMAMAANDSASPFDFTLRRYAEETVRRGQPKTGTKAKRRSASASARDDRVATDPGVTVAPGVSRAQGRAEEGTPNGAEGYRPSYSPLAQQEAPQITPRQRAALQQQQQQQQKRRQSKGGQDEAVFEQLYHSAMRSNERKMLMQMEAERQKQEKEWQELRTHCTFRPNVRSVSSTSRSKEDVYKRLADIDRVRKEVEHRILRSKVEQERFNDCTFRPRISTSNLGPQVPPGGSVSERLFRDAEDRTRRRQEQQSKLLETEEQNKREVQEYLLRHSTAALQHHYTQPQPQPQPTPTPSSQSQARQTPRAVSPPGSAFYPTPGSVRSAATTVSVPVPLRYPSPTAAPHRQVPYPVSGVGGKWVTLSEQSAIY